MDLNLLKRTLMKSSRLIGRLFLLLIPLAVVASGYLPVRNFSRDMYSGGAQNWGVVQDSLGRIYVANRDGLVVFDGSHWMKHTLANFTTVRSLYYDASTQKIYAGGSEELGYFYPDSISGILKYKSLLNNFKGNRPNFTEVWNIFDTEDKIWFQSDFFLMALSTDGRISSYRAPGRISKSALINRNIFVALDDGTLSVFRNSKFIPCKGSESLYGKKIVAILPYMRQNELLIATSTDGLFLYDGNSVRELDTDISDFLKVNQLFSAACDDNDYLFGTVNNGAVVKNFVNNTTKFINKNTGLQNNTVLSAMFDKSHNIWLSLDNGLSYAAYNTPLTEIVGAFNGVGAGYTSIRSGNNLLFGTNQGLYSTPFPIHTSPNPLPLKRELAGQIWCLTEVGGTVFVAGDAGLFVNDGMGYYRIPGIGGVYKISPLPNHADRALASTYDRFHIIRFDGSRWVDDGPVSGFNELSGNFCIDSRGIIWMSHWRRGVYSMVLDLDNKNFRNVKLYNSGNDLKSDYNNAVSIIDGRPYISSDDGFYIVDYSNGKLVPDNHMNEVFNTYPAMMLHPMPDGDLIMDDADGFRLARRNSDGKLAKCASVFRVARDKIMHGYQQLTSISPREIIVSNQDGFWSLDPDYSSSSDWSPRPFINAIFANRDSLVYSASPSGKDKSRLVLPYNLNSLRFELAFPRFKNPNSVQFSSYLKKYDKDWTPFTSESFREYTRLSDGKYILMIKAVDPETGEVTESSFEFTIKAPWYRTTLALIIYILISCGLVYAIVLYGRMKWRKSQNELRMRKEKELESLRKKAEHDELLKDVEIANLKSAQLEQDVKHKSQELSSTAMNLIRKNEILQDISADIAKIQSMQGSDRPGSLIAKQLSKIQADIAGNISHDDDLKAFNQNFDIVYENYTKRLMEKHPNLSAADRRMCCFIKMGLSSKEIAPLINISYKSVEMARYRLRKKMNLTSEQSLSDYLEKL